MTQLDLTENDADTVRLGRKRDHSRDPEILDAALDVLAEAGYDGMTVDMVAARAKAGKATLYRRWPSKAELVIDAVACLKQVDPDFSKLPDTGTLRGDLVALIKAPSIKDGERKMQIMSGLMSLIGREPQFGDAIYRALVEPRAAMNRYLLQRAIDRGEIDPGIDVELLSTLSQALVMQRTLIMRQPIDRDFLVSLIDKVILPAAGVRAVAVS